jgi:CheY-like chemotaxis protein
MPGISGAELAAALSPARAKGAVLLAMSASQPGEGIAEAFDGFLLKPFSALEFRSALESSAARRQWGLEVRTSACGQNCWCLLGCLG